MWNEALGFAPLAASQSQAKDKEGVNEGCALMLLCRPILLHSPNEGVRREKRRAFTFTSRPQSKEAARRVNQRLLVHTDFQAQSKAAARRLNRRLHLTLAAWPKSKEAWKSRIEGCIPPGSKTYLPLFYYVLSLYFLAIQYGCNSVGYLFSAFYYFCTIASKIGYVW